MKLLLYLLSVLVITTTLAFSQSTKTEENPFPKFTPYIAEKSSSTINSMNYDIKELGKTQPAMWLQVDPMADKYPGWSLYNYGMNNPIKFIDVNGDTVKNIDQKQLEDMMKNFNDEDKTQYEKYVNSEVAYEFSDIYYGYKIITEARKYIGLEYKLGEEDLNKGVDCSGFVWATLKELGYTGERFVTASITDENNIKNFKEVTDLVWGDIFLGGGHMGFYDPTPITSAPGKGGNYSGTYLSARTGYGSVQYGQQSWYTINKKLRIK